MTDWNEHIDVIDETEAERQQRLRRVLDAGIAARRARSAPIVIELRALMRRYEWDDIKNAMYDLMIEVEMPES